MKKIDIILALIIGEGFAFLFVWLLKKSGIEIFRLNFGLIIIFPTLVLIGVWISYLIGKKFLFFYQLTKFLLIGAFFAIFDLILFNLLLEFFGISTREGIKYTIFVATSFIIVTTIKYIADKYWAFEKTEAKEMGIEFGKFFIITLISGGIQIGVALLVFKVFIPILPISEIVGANIGKLSGIAVASVWNFLGYKFIVFKK